MKKKKRQNAIFIEDESALDVEVHVYFRIQVFWI